MKKILIYTLCLFLAGFTFQSCKNSDAKVKEDVENALKDRYSAVSVSVKDKEVTLTGSLQNQSERASAESVARGVKNVKSVINNITVQQATPTVQTTSDQTIKSSVETRLKAANYNDVKVQVVNGEVILTGDLDRSNLQNVMQIANETNEVKKVTNNLTLK